MKTLCFILHMVVHSLKKLCDSINHGFCVYLVFSLVMFQIITLPHPLQPLPWPHWHLDVIRILHVKTSDFTSLVIYLGKASERIMIHVEEYSSLLWKSTLSTKFRRPTSKSSSHLITIRHGHDQHQTPSL